MAWPTGNIDTQQMDQDNDSPLLARSAVKQMADQVNTIRDNGAPQLAADMTTAATAGKGVLRDENARIKAAAGVASDDVLVVSQIAGMLTTSHTTNPSGHLAATTTTAGFQSAADKLKQDKTGGTGSGLYTNPGTVTCTAGQQVTVLDGGGFSYVSGQTLIVFAEVTLSRGATPGNTHAYLTAATGGANLSTQIYSAGQSVAANGTITIQVVGVFWSTGTGTFTPRLSVISSGADSTVNPNGARLSARPLTLPTS